MNGKPPWEEKISDRLSGKYGYKDARVEILILLPPPLSAVKKTVSLTVSPDDLRRLKRAIDKAVAFADLPEDVRGREGAP